MYDNFDECLSMDDVCGSSLKALCHDIRAIFSKLVSRVT